MSHSRHSMNTTGRFRMSARPRSRRWKRPSAGLQAQGTQGRRATIEQFKRAVEIDDSFAVAHARLGTWSSIGGESVLGIQHTTRAFQLHRERTTDNEKFFITAAYHRQVTGNLEQALQAFDLSTPTLYPRTFDWSRSGVRLRDEGIGPPAAASNAPGKRRLRIRRRRSDISMPQPATCISIGSTKLRRRSSELRTGRYRGSEPPGVFTSRSSEGMTQPWNGSSCGPRATNSSPG